jgi:hypothetical protein
MQEQILKNWKTTTIGVILCISGFISFSPETFGGDKAVIVELSKYVLAGGLAGLGIVSKDASAT